MELLVGWVLTILTIFLIRSIREMTVVWNNRHSFGENF